MPFFTIITATYNTAATLPRLLDSLAEQTCRDFALIIQDGASTDDTVVSDSLECLNWYRDACLAWCNDKLEKNRFADQKYLNIFPQRFHRVHIMECRGGGVAPWNLADVTIEWRRSGPHINGSKIIFYHNIFLLLI